MKFLNLECSAIPCSVSITENGKILASSYSNVKLTHSQTLMPMVENTLKSANLTLKDIDVFSISSGPGSFTGIRIGISAVKGLTIANNISCVAVSTLEAMAQNYRDTDCIVCAVMDARCNQVYNALFEISNGVITRLCKDRALMCDELAKELDTNYDNKKIIVMGDGTELFYNYVNNLNNVYKSDEIRRYQNAIGVGLLAEKLYNQGKYITNFDLLPDYLRLPQAERELKLKKENKK